MSDKWTNVSSLSLITGELSRVITLSQGLHMNSTPDGAKLLQASVCAFLPLNSSSNPRAGSDRSDLANLFQLLLTPQSGQGCKEELACSARLGLFQPYPYVPIRNTNLPRPRTSLFLQLITDYMGDSGDIARINVFLTDATTRRGTCQIANGCICTKVKGFGDYRSLPTIESWSGRNE